MSDQPVTQPESPFKLGKQPFNRPPRVQFPSLPIEEIDIPPPPKAPPPPSQNWLIGVLPVMGIGVMAIFYLWRAAAVRGSSALFAIPLFVLAIFAISGTIFATRWRKRDHENSVRESKLDYVRTLEKKRARLQAAHNAELGILETNYPHPDTGLDRALAREPQLWERRPNDPDFMVARLGVGRVPSPIPISTPDPDSSSSELDRAMALADQYRYMHDVPALVSMIEHFAIGMSGRRDLMLSAARAVICHLAMAHPPDELHIHLVAPSAQVDEWRWLLWLPHASQDTIRDSLGFDTASSRVVLGNLSQTIDVRKEHTNIERIPHLLVIFDNPQLAESEAVYSTILTEGRGVGASALCLTNTYENIPGDCTAVVEIFNNGNFRLGQQNVNETIRGDAVDTLSLRDAEHIARALASVRLREVGTSGRLPRRVGFMDLYGVARIEDMKLYLTSRWTRDIPDGVLPFPVPIGRESLTQNIFLLLDEDHHGPHGVLAGTTGSGKSELLQTLVSALAIEHDPRLLNFLLIDFKGGSTFNAFAHLPHTVGTVTNLDGTLVERALEALKAETKYRQQFLKHMNVRDITQYYRFHAPTAANLTMSTFRALPHLFIIVDEFAQLAKEMPDFLRELVRTAQVGRSLGLHLILGTQSPMDVITDEMNANLQFRICLRVQNIESSRAMLRRPDAAYLPPGLAGRGYFQVGERGVYKQFQTAYAGGDYSGSGDELEPIMLELITPMGDTVNLLKSNPMQRETTEYQSMSAEPYTTATALIDIIRDHTESHALPYMPPLLLPPLEERISLEEPFVQADFGGWNGSEWRAAGRDEHGQTIRVGSAPIGLVDDVYTRQQYPLWVQLEDHGSEFGRSGHVLIIGGPGSGKTTALQTLAVSQSLLHPPDMMNLYFLSFTGSGLNHLSHLPHAERVVQGSESERVRRLFGRLLKILNERKNSRRRQGYLPLILLCVDGYEQLRDTYYDQHMPDFERLISEGRSAGIFVAFTANTVSAVPDRMRALVPQRIALRLSNNSDYVVAVGQVNTELQRHMPPGRAFIPGTPPLTCQISLPVFGLSVEDMEAQTRRIINDMRQGYAQRGRLQEPQPITELPAFIPLDSLPIEVEEDGMRTLIGQVDDDALSNYTLDWEESGPHFVVTGPPASGKTNLLHTIVLSAALAYPPDRVRFLLLDLTGRSLRQLEPLKHVIACVTNALEMEVHLRHLQNEMNKFAAEVNRSAGTPRAVPFRQRDIPKTVIVIDDYEVAADVMSMNLDFMRQLRDHARLSSDFGLHIWAAGYLERIGDPLMKQLLLRRSGFALQDKDSLHNLNVRATDLPNDMMPVGRAFFAQHNQVQVIQTALVDQVDDFVDWVNSYQWHKKEPADWMFPEHHRMDRSSEPQIGYVSPTNGGGSKSSVDPLDIDTAGLMEDLFGDLDDD